MPTFTPTLRGSKTEKWIALRFADARHNRFVSLSLLVHPKHWSKSKRRVKESHPDAIRINGVIDVAVAEAREIALDQRLASREPTAVSVRDEFARRREGSSEPEDFLSYADAVVADHQRHGRFETARRNKSVVKKLRAYVSGGRLPFEDVTTRFLREYRGHLAEHYGNSKNTQISNLRAIRAICNRAIADGLVDRSWYPFHGLVVGQESARKRKLSRDDVADMEALDLDDPIEALARDAFVFSFYVAGARFGDICTLRRADVVGTDEGPVLRYHTRKNGKETEVPLCPQAMTIVEKYEAGETGGFLFPILVGRDTSTSEKVSRSISSRNAVINRALKDVAARAGVDGPNVDQGVSFHMARHAWAAHALHSGWAIEEIRVGMRHRDTATSERYAGELSDGRFAERMRGLFSTARPHGSKKGMGTRA